MRQASANHWLEEFEKNPRIASWMFSRGSNKEADRARGRAERAHAKYLAALLKEARAETAVLGRWVQ